jgi:hypothetical protein
VDDHRTALCGRGNVLSAERIPMQPRDAVLLLDGLFRAAL